MKRVVKHIILLSTVICASSCYDDLTQDYETNGAYFSYQQPFRTVIADRDGMDEGNAITVGCSIGGKTTVDVNDWVSFEIDESLITSDMGLVAMPEDYYTLSSENLMTNKKANNFIVEVDVEFTEKFFNDSKATGQYYAIPFRALETNLDVILEEKDYTIVAVKFISLYHGTYYVQSRVTLVDTNYGTDDATTYESWNDDVSQNQYVDFSTISRYEIQRDAETLTVGDNTVERAAFSLKVATDGSVTIESDDLVADSATVKLEYNGTSEDCEFTITYRITYESEDEESKTYEFEEIYTRRQDPLDDLSLELWSVEEE